MMNREEFVYHMYTELTKFFGLGAVRQGEDDFTYHVKLKDSESSIVVYLGNTWNSYTRSKGDMSPINNFLKTQEEVVKMVQTGKKPMADLTKLVPVLRHKDYMKDSEGHPDKVLKEDFSDELSVYYAEDSETMVKILTKNAIPDGMTEDEFSEIAFENAKKLGWTEPQFTKTLTNGIDVSLYHNPNEIFHAQFIIRQLFEPKIGESFYLSLPTRGTAIVLTIDESIVTDEKDIANALLFMKTATFNMHTNEPSPLGTAVHKVGEGVTQVI